MYCRGNFRARFQLSNFPFNTELPTSFMFYQNKNTQYQNSIEDDNNKKNDNIIIIIIANVLDILILQI